MHHFMKTKAEQEMMEQLDLLIPIFREREALLDELNSFPEENINDLKKIGYHLLTLLEADGGKGMGLYSFVLMQEKIAQGCGSTALSIGWHLGNTLEYRERRHWNPKAAPWLCKEIQQGALVNSAITERNAGSPTRGAKPQTTASLSGDQWIITGEKTYTSMAPAVDYFFVSATIVSSGEIARFIVPKKAEGVSIRETWDSVAMRGTASHDLVMNEVKIPKHFLLENLSLETKQLAKGWSLHIPACYLGIAGAARDYAISFAASFAPTSLGKPIATLPNIRQAIGEIELKLQSARHVLYSAAALYEEGNDDAFIQDQLDVAKVMITNTAIDVVDKAMRIVGARALSQSNPMHRYYLNVRAGISNPPMEDLVFMKLAKKALEGREGGEKG